MLSVVSGDRSPRVHFSGIGGTGMVAVARLAIEAGWDVRGSDNPLYPPTSDMVAALNVPVAEGYAAANLDWEPDVVIIGNGMAAARLVEELNKRALGRYAVAVIGDEPRLAYNRVLLSSVLAREVSRGDIELKSADWWRAHGVTLLYGHRAVSIDADIRRVKLANGATLPYGKLVLATGSKAIRLNVPGMDMPGVVTFRDLADVASMELAAKAHKQAAVIGGGLLGL